MERSGRPRKMSPKKAKAAGAAGPKKGTRKRRGRRKRGAGEPPPWWRSDPRPPTQILAEEVLLTKQMVARVLGYRNVRSVDLIVAEDCASQTPCLKPVYLRRPPAPPGERRPANAPSFKSVRFRREDVLAYVEKMQEDFPHDLEWRFGGER